MGKIDKVTREYIKNPVVVADVFNYIAYNGKKVIKPDNLTRIDTNSLIGIYDTLINNSYDNSSSHKKGPITKKKRTGSREKNNTHFIDRYRDAISMLSVTKDDKAIYALLGIEAQSYINYAMPVKNMLYDSIQYSVQITDLTNLHKTNKDKTDGKEFLSGMLKEDKLKPVITLVVYFGTEEWDGAKKLSDLLEDTDEHLKALIQDYELTIINPLTMADKEFDKFSTDLGIILKLIKYSSNKEMLLNILQGNSNLGKLTRQGAQVLCDSIGFNMDITEDEMEGKKMCKALAELIEDGRNEGMQAGKKIGLIEGRQSGLIEGRQSGLIEGRQSSAIRMFTRGISIDDISYSIETPVEQVKKWIEESKI